MTLTYDALKKENEELRQRAETAERELAADLPYRERWQQAQDENQELRAKLAGMKQGWRVVADSLSGKDLILFPSVYFSEQEARQVRQRLCGSKGYVNVRVQTRVHTTEWKDADQEVDRG